MKPKAKVLVQWLLPMPKNSSILNVKVIRPARFECQGDYWTDNAWSIVLQTEGMEDDVGRQIGTVQFLVEDAPHDWLSPGNKFTLHEGQTVLAECKVLSVSCG